MTLQAIPIAAGSSAPSAGLPAALRGTPGTKDGFRALFSGKLDKTADVSSDVMSRLASLLQGGIPVTAITTRIAKELSDALARAAGDSGDAKARSTLERALAAALAPPGTSPPASSGEAARQAATLEQRLQDLLETLTSQLKTAGQKSEFSGHLLDAKSAKDIPAPQKDTTAFAGVPADEMAAFVRALLNHAVAGASTPAVSPKQAPVQAHPIDRSPSGTAPAPADLLTRMIARAVNADAQRSTSASPALQAPAAILQRAIAIVAQHAGTQTDAHGGENPEQSAGQKLPTPAPASAPPSLAGGHQTSASGAPLFAAHLTQTGLAAQTHASSLAYSTVDPNAVVEQIVKSIMVRNAGATSEIRLRLQPEHLGDVTLKLSVTGNTIAANVVAQNANVRDMLLANQQQLARSLASAGLALGNFSVDVSGGNAGFTGGSRHHRSSGNAGAAFGAALIGEDESWTDAPFAPAAIAGAKPLVLNYLV